MTVSDIASGDAPAGVQRIVKKHPQQIRADFSRMLKGSVHKETGTPAASGEASKRALQWILLGALTNAAPPGVDLLVAHHLLGKAGGSELVPIQDTPVPDSRQAPGAGGCRDARARTIVAEEPTGDAPGGMTGGGRSRLPDPLSERLVESARRHIGKSYTQLDCYELVIRALTDMGLRYQGSGGLKEHLVNAARGKGLSGNAYLTGEGLIDSSATRVYAKSVSGIREPGKEAEKLLEDLSPRLNAGYLLSFSTPTRGHVGIISRREGRWTLINSGRMDNPLSETHHREGVGEEDLSGEILNWFRRAAKHKETLEITVGRLEGMKLVGFSHAAPRAEHST